MDTADLHLYRDGDELLAAPEPHGGFLPLHARCDYVRLCGRVSLGFLALRGGTPSARRASRAGKRLRVQAPAALIGDIPQASAGSTFPLTASSETCRAPEK